MIFTFNRFLEELLFYFKRLLSSGYIRKGKCNYCGNCCRNIVFCVGDEAIKTSEQFEKVKKWNRGYNHFFISGTDEDNSLLFTCKSLGDDNKCKSYNIRSVFCRLYPFVNKKLLINGGKTLDGCGFYFEADKKFTEYFNK